MAFFNSLLYSLAATAICVILASMAAYVLARRRTRSHKLLYLLLIMGIAMPTNFVTLMQVMQWTHLVNTQIGIILLYAAMQIPFSVFLVYAFIGTIPRELDEAAFIDGCTSASSLLPGHLPACSCRCWSRSRCSASSTSGTSS